MNWSADGILHPVQQGVLEEQGFQCAFCMSGFIMATVGLLKTNPNPTRSELAHGISGNLCRRQERQDPDCDDAGRGDHEEDGSWVSAGLTFFSAAYRVDHFGRRKP